jgi:hypothetical protein
MKERKMMRIKKQFPAHGVWQQTGLQYLKCLLALWTCWHNISAHKNAIKQMQGIAIQYAFQI